MFEQNRGEHSVFFLCLRFGSEIFTLTFNYPAGVRADQKGLYEERGAPVVHLANSIYLIMPDSNNFLIELILVALWIELR